MQYGDTNHRIIQCKQSIRGFLSQYAAVSHRSQGKIYFFVHFAWTYLRKTTGRYEEKNPRRSFLLAGICTLMHENRIGNKGKI